MAARRGRRGPGQGPGAAGEQDEPAEGKAGRGPRGRGKPGGRRPATGQGSASPKAGGPKAGAPKAGPKGGAPNKGAKGGSTKGGRRGGGRHPPKAAPVDEGKPKGRSDQMARGNPLADKLNAAAAHKATDTSAAAIRVEVPDLADIRVVVEAPPPPSNEDVEARLEELRIAYTPYRAREPGEPVEMGDEILVDSVGYAHGDLFSSQMDTWLKIEPNELLPGLFENLVGTPTATHTVIPLTLPDDYPEEEFKGASAAFAIDIKAANGRAGDLDMQALLAELGYGDDEDKAKKAIYDELEKNLAAELVTEARNQVLDVVYEREAGDVPDSMIEAELQKDFRVEQGEHLAKAGVSIEDQNGMFDVYTQDEGRRKDVRRRLWEEAFLDALADHFEIAADSSELMKLMAKLAGAAGLTSATVHTALKRDEETEAQLVVQMRRSQALEKVLEACDVQFVPAGTLDESEGS